jgi:hypothetical protein
LELEARLAVEAARAERDRIAAEAKAEQKRLDAEAEAERQRRAVIEKRRQELADKRQAEAEKAARKAARAAKRARRLRWLKAHPADLFVVFVMVASIVPAVISQVLALTGAGVFVAMAALLAAMLEGSAWAVTLMAKQAEEAGRPAGKFRVAGWVFASIAAAVNFWHGAEQYADHLWVAPVLAGSSLVAYFVWDLKQHGSDGATRAEKREAKARGKHAAKRRSLHKDVAKEADRLIAALPFGQLTEEAAFEAAWRIRHGAEPGMTAATYAATTAARVELGAAFQLGEDVRPELLRTGMLAAALSPLPGRLADRLPTLGPVSPIPALPGGAEGRTTQAGIGLYASERPAAQGDTGPLVGRSDQELEELLPDAHAAAAELVAEGKQISAAGLSRKLRIRREDALRLRNLVVGERKLHAVAAEQKKRPSVSARVS